MRFLLLIIIIVVLFCFLSYPTTEQYGDYKQMSRLPWCTPPTGIGGLGYGQCVGVKAAFPGRVYDLGYFSQIPEYETGDTMNPNVYSTWGVVTPPEL